MPNYVDDVQDFEQFDDDEADAGTYGEPVPFKEEDEIEMVLGHSRDEQHLSDPEDNWYTNLVRKSSTRIRDPPHGFPHRDSILSGRISLICTTPTRCMSS